MSVYRKEQFVEIADPDVARDLFAACVGRIELETHSYCNRRCGYCPNVSGDRLGPNIRMPDAMLRRIADDLRAIDYAGILALNSYNEPLFDRNILECLRVLSAAAPKADLQIHTNGDYLDERYIEELADAGLRRLFISVHVNGSASYSDAYAMERIAEVSARCGLVARIQRRNEAMILAKLPHRKLRIEARAVDYWRIGQSRGGLVDIKRRYVRTKPCHFPFFHFHIGYTGNVVPCCHILSDHPDHAAFRIGNLADFQSIYLAYTSAAAVAWRRHLAGFAEKRDPCTTCDAVFLDGRQSTLTKYQRLLATRLSEWAQPPADGPAD